MMLIKRLIESIKKGVFRMKDRLPTYPGRIKLIPVDGQENVFDMVRADEPVEGGTPLNKATLLSDQTAEKIWGENVPDNPTVDNALSEFAERKLYNHSLRLQFYSSQATAEVYLLIVSYKPDKYTESSFISEIVSQLPVGETVPICATGAILINESHNGTQTIVQYPFAHNMTALRRTETEVYFSTTYTAINALTGRNTTVRVDNLEFHSLEDDTIISI